MQTFLQLHLVLYSLGDTLQITGWVDDGLNERAFIVPGLGDFGERRCAYYAWYGQEDTLTPFQVLCMICLPGRSFGFSHFSWFTMDYENASLSSTTFTRFFCWLRWLSTMISFPLNLLQRSCDVMGFQMP